MARRVIHIFFMLSVALLLFPTTGNAQINLQQQMPNYSGGAQSSAPEQGKMQVPHNSPLMTVPEDFDKLKLAPGFLVSLNVISDSDFTGSFRIDGQGNLVLPILGILHVAGETASEATDQIKKKLLEDQILKNPQVTLTVLEFAAPEVTIIGEVMSPGKYALLAPHKLVDVLALAGGPTMLAGNQVQIMRGGGATGPILVHYSRSADPNTVEDVVVHPGDTVQMKRAGVVYVLGAVNRPGGYILQEDGTLTVLQAISLAYGTAITASTGTIHLLRRNVDGTEVDIAISYKKMVEGKAADMQVHATDVLYVPTSKVKSALINSQAVLSSAASAAIYAGILH